MYEIRCQVIGSSVSLSIEEADYIRLQQAHEGSFKLLAIEEKYDLLVRSYVAFEQVVHRLALSNLMFVESSWSEFIDHIQAVNLELINHLSLCRTYVDHLPQNLNGIFGANSDQAKEFSEATSKEYDDHLGYRVLYALRNYVQHCGLPIHSLTFQNNWLRDNDADPDCAHAAEPHLSTSILAREGEFKAAVLTELMALGEKVDVRPLVKVNMSSFGRLHSLVRQLVGKKASEWDKAINDAISSYTEKFGENVTGLSAIKRDENGKIASSFPIFDDMICRRSYLADRNRTYTNLERHFITGRIGA